jgi:hypothetical protein
VDLAEGDKALVVNLSNALGRQSSSLAKAIGHGTRDDQGMQLARR